MSDPLAPEMWLGLDMADGSKGVFLSQREFVRHAVMDAAREAAKHGVAVKRVLLTATDWARFHGETGELRLDPGTVASCTMFGPTGPITVELAE